MKKVTKIIVTSVITLGLATSAFAFGSKHMKNMSAEDKVEKINERVTDKLELNEDQQAKFANLSSRLMTLMQEAKAQHKNPKEMIGEFINDEPLDQAALLEKITSKTALVNQHAPEVVGLLATFVDSLNAEQKAEAKEMISKMKKRGHRGGKGKGHRGGKDGKHRDMN